MGSRFVRVASASEVSEQQGRLIVVEGEDIALFKRNGTIYALQNVCAHQHFSKLHEGVLDGLHVTCPMHGWRYDMTTGKAVGGGGKVRTYGVKVEGGEIFLEISEEP